MSISRENAHINHSSKSPTRSSVSDDRLTEDDADFGTSIPADRPDHSSSNGLSQPLKKDAFTTMGLQMVPTHSANDQRPCEPGTNVTLEGVVWQETDGGKTFVN